MIKKKVCSKCGEEKPATTEFFSYNNQNKLSARCKDCDAKYHKEYRKKNKEKLKKKRKEKYWKNREENIKNAVEWYNKNEDKKKAYDKRRNKKNKAERKRRAAKYYKKNKIAIKKRVAERAKERLRTDEAFNVKCRLRHRLREAFKRYSKNGKVKPSKDYGIDWKAIIVHLGDCPGNIKEYHIDHIIPLSAFDFNDLNQIKLAFAPENHQWLKAEDNLTKNCNYDAEKFVEYLNKKEEREDE